MITGKTRNHPTTTLLVPQCLLDGGLLDRDNRLGGCLDGWLSGWGSGLDRSLDFSGIVTTLLSVSTGVASVLAIGTSIAGVLAIGTVVRIGTVSRGAVVDITTVSCGVVVGITTVSRGVVVGITTATEYVSSTALTNAELQAKLDEIPCTQKQHTHKHNHPGNRVARRQRDTGHGWHPC